MNEHEGTEAWRQGVRDAVAWVRYRQTVMPDLQPAPYSAALADVLIHLEAMPGRGTASATSRFDSEAT